MCGLFVTNDQSINKSHLTLINKRLAFRGPDFQSELVQHKGWSLYHSRLSIIATEERFSQPFRTDNGGILVFNGEILNFQELAIEFRLKNILSDTQVLGKLLEIENFDINKLEGFFAFVYLDRNGNLKNCCRDRLGVKPLNYYKKDGIIAISSEASILSDLYDIPYSEDALEEYKVFRAPIFKGSYFEGVKAVIPGNCLVNGEYFNSLSLVQETYSDPLKLEENLKIKLRDAVSSRLVSDVPVGLLFSGGIDSNLIRTFASEDFECFTGGFSGDYDVDYAKNFLKNKSNLIEVSEKEFNQRLREMVELRKEPLSVPNEIILSFLADSWATKGGKVLLSGEAADELFAGYDRIYRWAMQDDKFDILQFLELYAYLPVEEIESNIIESLNNFFSSLDPLSKFEKVRQFFIKMHLPVLFRRLDFALMFSGIEGREPLAATEIMKIALKFSPQSLFKNNLGKYPLRSIAREALGEEFAFTPKVGFPIDIVRLMTGIESKNRQENYSVWCNENLRLIK